MLAPSPASPAVRPLAWRIDDAARQLGVGRTSIYRAIADGRLTSCKVAGRVVIPDTDLRAFLDAAMRASA